MMGAKIIKLCGIVLCAFTAIGFLATIGDGFDGATLIVILVFGGAGVSLLRVGSKSQKRAESVKKYLNIIINGGQRELDAIAATTGKSYDVVKKDIQMMIDRDYFKNAYIDENTREIVLPSASPANANTNATTPLQEMFATPAQVRVVACPCCGANNTVSVTIGECEYCGTTLQ